MPDHINAGLEGKIILRWVWTRHVVAGLLCRLSGLAWDWVHCPFGLVLHDSGPEFDRGSRLGPLQDLAGVVLHRKMRVRALLILAVASRFRWKNEERGELA